MSEPIVEQIAAAILTQAQTVTEANSYNVTLSVIRPAMDDDYAPVHLKTVMQQLSASEDDENDVEGNPPAKAWIQPFEFNIFARVSNSNTSAIETVLNRAASDLEKALMQTPQWGSLAWRTEVRARAQWSHTQGAFEGITVNIDVYYRTDEDDPYVAR